MRNHFADFVLCRAVASALVALPIAACAPPQPRDKTDAERAELNGPVEEVSTTFRADRKDRYGDVDERALGLERFDRQGLLIEDEDYTPDFVKKRRPKHIDRNRTYFQSAMGDSTERYVFDTKGNVTETDIWYGSTTTGAPAQIVRAKYDDRSCRIEQTFIDPDGKVGGGSTYQCDGGGNIVREDEWLNNPRRPHAVSTYSYDFDAHGNWIKRYQKRTGVSDDSYDYGKVGTLIRTITYYGK